MPAPKPTALPPDWATNVNYSGGPAVGTPTKVAPTGGLDAEGWEPAQEPGAQNLNYLLSLIDGSIKWMMQGQQLLFNDQIVNALVGNVKLTGTSLPDLGGNNGVDAPTHLAYALHGGSAYVRPGSGLNKVQIAPGILFQKIAPSGTDPTVLSYPFLGADEVTIADGNTVNPRIDLVQMKLDWSAAPIVTLTLSVKAGTAAATPQFPDPDAGYVAVAAVYVGKNYTSAVQLSFGVGIQTNSDAHVMDLRMPINVQPMQTDPQMMRMKTAWVFGTSFGAYGEYATSNNATNEVRVPATKGGRIGRLVAISAVVDNITDSTSNLINAFGFQNNGFFAQQWTVPAGFGGLQWELATIPYYTFEANYQGYGFFGAYTVSTVNKIGVPIWSNGMTAPYTLGNNITRLTPGGVDFALVSGQNSSVLAGFNWHWAVGI